MPNTFIIIKGQPKALQIERFQMGNNSVYEVKFKSSPLTYHYRYSDVVWLKDAVWHDHLHCKVYIGGREQHNVEDIRSFQHGEQTHWRIIFSNGFVQDYLHGSIHVVESCLADDIANNAFKFLIGIYFPTQNLEKMFWRVSSVVISPPTISARWCIHERRSALSRSALRPASSACSTRTISSRARESAS